MSAQTRDQANGQNRGVLAYLQSDFVNTALYFARVGVVFSCIVFMFNPIFTRASPASTEVWYHRALIASAAVSALRLHQRLKSATERPSIATVISEDSFHYLVYSLLFALMSPVSVALMPVFTMALLHIGAFTQRLLTASTAAANVATGDGPDARVTAPQPSYLRNLLERGLYLLNSNNPFLLHLVALNEIILMLICVLLAFSGQRTVILPLIYYPFIKMRYNSQKSPYMQRAFRELRMSLHNVACHPKCPGICRSLINGVINMVCRLGSSGVGI